MKGYNPYSKGRWYRFFIESNGGNATITESDIDGTSISKLNINNVDCNTLVLPLGYKVLDVVIDIHTIGGMSKFAERVSTIEGNQGIVIPDNMVFDFAYIYVFCELNV